MMIISVSMARIERNTAEDWLGHISLLPWFFVTDFLPPLLSPQKNGIIGITNIFKEAGQMGIYVNPDNADFRRCLKKTMLSNEVKVDLIEFYQRNKKQINRKL